MDRPPGQNNVAILEKVVVVKRSVAVSAVSTVGSYLQNVGDKVMVSHVFLLLAICL